MRGRLDSRSLHPFPGARIQTRRPSRAARRGRAIHAASRLLPANRIRWSPPRVVIRVERCAQGAVRRRREGRNVPVARPPCAGTPSPARFVRRKATARAVRHRTACGTMCPAHRGRMEPRDAAVWRTRRRGTATTERDEGDPGGRAGAAFNARHDGRGGARGPLGLLNVAPAARPRRLAPRAGAGRGPARPRGARKSPR
jgi:hypothetical protein